MGKWYARSEFVSKIIDIYFEDMTLDNVLEKAKDFGHLDAEMVPGYILRGSYVEKHLGVTFDGSFDDDVVPIISSMTKGKDVSVYQNTEECSMRVQHDDDARKQTIQMCDLKAFVRSHDRKGVGSLNTYDYYEEDAMSGCELLDCMFDELKKYFHPQWVPP